MHEMMVADSLLRIILQANARGVPGRAISARISCGQLNAINDDVLGFALEAIAKGTVCEGMHLEVEHKPLQAECRACATGLCGGRGYCQGAPVAGAMTSA